MKIPRKLKIKRSTWSVSIDDSIEEKYNAVGLCKHSSKEIVISPDQTRNEMEETLLHEILHACFPNDVCSDRLEEKIVNKLAPALLHVLKANKLF